MKIDLFDTKFHLTSVPKKIIPNPTGLGIIFFGTDFTYVICDLQWATLNDFQALRRQWLYLKGPHEV
jgi:hypothetical protein